MKIHTDDTEQTMKWQFPHLKQITLSFFLKTKPVNNNVQSCVHAITNNAEFEESKRVNL